MLHLKQSNLSFAIRRHVGRSRLDTAFFDRPRRPGLAFAAARDVGAPHLREGTRP